jgi:hypothetical protein
VISDSVSAARSFSATVEHADRDLLVRDDAVTRHQGLK